MSFIERYDVIQELRDGYFRPVVQPLHSAKALGCPSVSLSAPSLQEVVHLSVKLRVMVQDHIAAAHGVRERLAKLLQGPAGGGMPGNVEVQDLASSMMDDKQE